MEKLSTKQKPSLENGISSKTKEQNMLKDANLHRKPTKEDLYKGIKQKFAEYNHLVSIGKRPKAHKRDYAGSALGISGRQVTNIVNSFEKPQEKETPKVKDISGFVYIITNKSTGEYYIGESEFIPTSRWYSHITNKSSPITSYNISDYKFEVLEVVLKHTNLCEREDFYIEKYYKDNPKKMLNDIVVIDGKKQRKSLTK